MKPFLSDDELAILERNPEYTHFGNECPVCMGEKVYRYKGEEHECPDDEYGHSMLRLARLYWVHNIPLQYQQLDFADYPDNEARAEIEAYLEDYKRMRLMGIGVSFMSKKMGIGKTWGATHVLKELVKRGVDGWFVPFWQIPQYKDMEDRREAGFRIRRLQNAELVVIDDVAAGQSFAQDTYYASKLEEFIRPRTDSNLPTIITTNMVEQDLEDTFPRIFSVLAAKNIVVSINGSDARVDGRVYNKNIQMIQRGETRPIT